jgi:phosphoglycolate phosphatase-like HAD superfamily hydrolase
MFFMKTISNFKRTKDLLVCVDSDGCAMDTMDIKHFNCFGPCMVDEWSLHQWGEDILKRWNEINLYTITRGINRFKGLAMALGEINERYTEIEGIDALLRWAEEAPELSNNALETVIAHGGEEIFKKALAWSKAVNLSITALPEEDKLPFPLAKEALEFAHRYADVAIVSSANLGAVLEEWQTHGLIDHVDVIMSQNDGSKAFCISELLKHGYDKEKTLMCGDAPGDLAAAEKNGVYFYPILVGKEGDSWQEFMDTAMAKLTSGDYSDYGEGKKREFYKNLGE